MIKEVWKSIKNYEGCYEVSNLGSVRSVERVINVIDGNRKYKKPLAGKILSEEKHNAGYKCVSLYKNCKGKTFYVHRLVAEAFIDNPKEKPQINHKDGDKSNNNVNNLEWCTVSENIQYAYDFQEHSNSRSVICLNDNNVFKSQSEAARFYGIGQSHISACCNGLKKGIKFNFCSCGRRTE